MVPGIFNRQAGAATESTNAWPLLVADLAREARGAQNGIQDRSAQRLDADIVRTPIKAKVGRRFPRALGETYGRPSVKPAVSTGILKYPILSARG